MSNYSNQAWESPGYTPKRLARREARYLRRMNGTGNEVYQAAMRGEADRYYGRLYRNIYPVGKRHDAYNWGFKTPDSTNIS